MNRKIFLLPVTMALVATFSVSCNKDPLAQYGEQYKKTVYLVHSESIEYVREHSFENVDDTITFSIYCSSSEPITSDLTVSLKKDPRVLDSLNFINSLGNANYIPKELLGAERYSFENGSTIIRTGTQYGLLKIPVKLTGIDVDKEYVLPITLTANDRAFDINPKLQSIAYRPVMINRFSGIFTGSSKLSTETSPRAISPKLVAMERNKVRLPIHNLSDDKAMLATNYMILTIQEDGKSVVVESYKDSEVTDEGGSEYDAISKRFTLNYSYKDGAAKRSIKSVIQNIDAIENEL